MNKVRLLQAIFLVIALNSVVQAQKRYSPFIPLASTEGETKDDPIVSTTIGITTSSNGSRIGRGGRNDEQQQMYETYCISTAMRYKPEFMLSREERMRRMCMCNVLKDIQRPDTSLQSIGGKQNVEIECINGKVITHHGVEYECSNFIFLSFITNSDMNVTTNGGIFDFYVGQISSLWGWSSSDNSIEIAMVGAYSGVAFVDISLATNPTFIGTVGVPSNGRPTLWHDIRTYQDHAYIVSEAGNLQYINMTTVVEVYKRNGGDISLTKYAKEFGNTTLKNTHTIEINEKTGYAYLVGTNLCNQGMYMIDVRNPSNPKDAGCFTKNGYVHEVHCVIYNGTDTRYVGKEICFACTVQEVTIIDVSNKRQPVILSRLSYPGRKYTHQGVLDEKHEYFIFGDEYDEIGSLFFIFNLFNRKPNHPSKTLVMNVFDLQKPYIVGYHLSSTPATDHNQYIKGMYTYQANYRAGLRVLHLTDLSRARMTEVAYFDIYPQDNKKELNGAWNVYPFFPSGSIIISSIERGLFVLAVNQTALQLNVNDPTPIATNQTCDNQAVCSRGQFFDFLRQIVRITMYTSTFGTCRERCVPEFNIPTMINEGWTCGKCP